MDNDNSGKARRRAVYKFLSVWGIVTVGSLTIGYYEIIKKTPILLLGIDVLYYLGALLALTGLILYKYFSIKRDRGIVIIYFIILIPFFVFFPRIVSSLFKSLEVKAFISILILALIVPVTSFFRNVYVKDLTLQGEDNGP